MNTHWHDTALADTYKPSLAEREPHLPAPVSPSQRSTPTHVSGVCKNAPVPGNSHSLDEHAYGRAGIRVCYWCGLPEIDWAAASSLIPAPATPEPRTDIRIGPRYETCDNCGASDDGYGSKIEHFEHCESPLPAPGTTTLVSRPGDPRDWPEDFSHENGRYYNTCTFCHQPFCGHKRRVVCKLCSGAPGTTKPATPTLHWEIEGERWLFARRCVQAGYDLYANHASHGEQQIFDRISAEIDAKAAHIAKHDWPASSPSSAGPRTETT